MEAATYRIANLAGRDCDEPRVELYRFPKFSAFKQTFSLNTNGFMRHKRISLWYVNVTGKQLK